MKTVGSVAPTSSVFTCWRESVGAMMVAGAGDETRDEREEWSSQAMPSQVVAVVQGVCVKERSRENGRIRVRV